MFEVFRWRLVCAFAWLLGFPQDVHQKKEPTTKRKPLKGWQKMARVAIMLAVSCAACSWLSVVYYAGTPSSKFFGGMAVALAIPAAFMFFITFISAVVEET